jgi:dUTP pyrophosphatase
MQVQLLVKPLSSNATVPTRGSLNAAGYDLYSAVDITIPKQGTSLVSTDLSIALVQNDNSPANEYYARIAPRSGLGVKFIDVGAGVVDCDYRGPVKVVIYNHTINEFKISKGDRIAQLIIERIAVPEIKILDNNEELPGTQRGDGGFGSTGK